jgi:hypothetical protein
MWRQDFCGVHIKLKPKPQPQAHDDPAEAQAKAGEDVIQQELSALMSSL